MADTALFCGATGSRGIHPTSARCTRDRDVNQPDSRPTRVPCQNTPCYPRHRRQSCCKEWFKCTRTRVRICPRHELAKTSRLEGYHSHPRSAPIALAHVSNRAFWLTPQLLHAGTRGLTNAQVTGIGDSGQAMWGVTNPCLCVLPPNPLSGAVLIFLINPARLELSSNTWIPHGCLTFASYCY